MWNKKRKNDLYFEILEKCANNGLFDTIDCMPEIKQYLIKINLDGVSNWYDLPNMLLEPLEREGYIHLIRVGYSDEEMAVIPPNWMDKLYASVSIKPKGLLFLYEKRKIDETKRGNNLTRAFIIVTAILGLLTLLLTAKNTLITIRDDGYKEDIRLNKLDISQRDKLIKRLRQDSVHLQALYHNKPLTH